MDSQANTIERLNSRFLIPDKVIFADEKYGFPTIKVCTQKASALISVYAGQVLSYKPAKQNQDLFFISDNAYFTEGKAIKGGIPICWPWFGSGVEKNQPDHGFVRNRYWRVDSVTELLNEDIKISLTCSDDEESRKIWPHRFQLTLDIIIGQTLTLELLTRNIGDQPFLITEALHTYFQVGDSSKLKILGLEHSEYLDKTQDFAKACQVGAVTLSEQMDQIFSDTRHDLIIDDPVHQRKIQVTSSGNKNVVVWNPGKAASNAIKDLDKDDFKKFICVETANAAENKVEVQPNCGYWMSTNYKVE